MEPKEPAEAADPGDLVAHLVGLGGWESSGPGMVNPGLNRPDKTCKNPMVLEHDLQK